MTTPTPKRRPLGPILLIAAGVAGLGLAAASELTLSWTDKFQAGVTTVAADCQADGEAIDVRFSEPKLEASAATDPNTGTPWSVATIEFTGISEACDGTDYEVAIREDAGTEWVSLATGKVDAPAISASLGDTNPQELVEVALTLHGTPSTEG